MDEKEFNHTSEPIEETKTGTDGLVDNRELNVRLFGYGGAENIFEWAMTRLTYQPSKHQQKTRIKPVYRNGKKTGYKRGTK